MNIVVICHNHVKEGKTMNDKEEHTMKEKIQETLKDISKSDAVVEIRSYAQSNRLETSGMIVLIIGLLLTFWPSKSIGLGLVGLVAGTFYYREAINYYCEVKCCFHEYGLFRVVLPIGVILGVFIASPALVIGAVIAAGVKILLSMKLKKNSCKCGKSPCEHTVEEVEPTTEEQEE